MTVLILQFRSNCYYIAALHAKDQPGKSAPQLEIPDLLGSGHVVDLAFVTLSAVLLLLGVAAGPDMHIKAHLLRNCCCALAKLAGCSRP